jgi:putative flippase GtrA
LRERLVKFIHSWAAKSLLVGAVATGIDLAIGLSLNTFLHIDTRWSAMSGTVVGATFTYFANRYFAFKEKNPELASSMAKFIVVTVLSTLLHGQVVVWLHDRLGWPFTVSKMLADVAIFTFAQLFVFRYIVFPKSKAADAPVSLPRPSVPRFS